jgi:GTP-binding protein
MTLCMKWCRVPWCEEWCLSLVLLRWKDVGKSSLINMIVGRKALAYTSKRPGKTQQFNFFAVNDKVDREKEIKYGDVIDGEKDFDSFNIVDLPGFGYARVPEHKRKQWAELMRKYISERETLRVLFHLVDGRRGPTEEDAFIMKQVGEELPSYATYVIVLTKADKNVKNASIKNSGKVSSHVMDQLRSAMKESGVGHVPVLLSSAETKLGRDDLWRYLRIAAEC